MAGSSRKEGGLLARCAPDLSGSARGAPFAHTSGVRSREVVVDRFSLALRSAEVGDEGGYMMFEIGGFERLMDVRWDATKYGLRACGLKQQR